MGIRFLCFLVALCLYAYATAESITKVDSLTAELEKDLPDTVRINILNTLAWKYRTLSEYEQTLEYANQALNLAQQKSYNKGEASAYNNMGAIDLIQGNYKQAMMYFRKSLKIGARSGDKKEMATAYNNIGLIYKNQGNYGRAIAYYMKSLKIEEEIGDKQGMASSYNNIGTIHKHQHNYSQAMNYYTRSLKIKEEIGDKKGMASAYNNIGLIYKNKGNYEQAIAYYMKSLKIEQEIGDKSGMAFSYINIGSLFITVYKKGARDEPLLRAGDMILPRYVLLDSALQYHLKGYEIKKAIGDKRGSIYSLCGLGDILFQKKNYKSALHFYTQAAGLADSIGAKKELYKAYEGIARVYAVQGNGMKAYEYHKKYSALRDTVLSKNAKEKLAREETRHAYEKKMQDARLEREKERLQTAERARQQQIIITSVTGGLILVLAFLAFLYNRFRVTQHQKKVIETQKALVDEKNKAITDSINYAERIQAAVLPAAAQWKRWFPNAFVLFKPKDIVSGDFYFMTKVRQHFIFAVVDCTGHGVPGAMMSMMGSDLLTQIVSEKQVSTSGQVLDELDSRILKSLNPEGQGVPDGMDIALCALHAKTLELQYAGANNPLYMIRNGKLREISPDNQPIGHYKGKKPFTNHTLKLQKGDTLYLFSDGFVDQFGGVKGKKFMKKRFKKLLLSIQDKDMDEQQQILDEKLVQWMKTGNEAQVDDICVAGIRI